MPMSEIRALLFDMDGVIVDSNPLHRVVWEEYNRRQCLVTTEEMQQRMYGKRNDEIVRDFYGAALSPDEVFRHGAAKEALYREMLLPRIETALVPGVRAFLQQPVVRRIRFARSSEPSPHSSTPQLLLTVSRSVASVASTASMRACGIPHSPNPPTARDAPLAMPATASAAEPTTLSTAAP